MIVYGAVPPTGVTTTSVTPPLQAITPVVVVKLKTVGSVIVTETGAVQPLASVTVKLCVPAVRPV